MIQNQVTIEQLIKTIDVLQVKINQYAEQVNPAMLGTNLKPEEINQLKFAYKSIQETEKQYKIIAMSLTSENIVSFSLRHSSAL
ncbi:MAG: hypothetical protein HC905_32030 [Bacteroidales bacterium]|nr:hypothetical protein [Bacteroidales bacterium]